MARSGMPSLSLASVSACTTFYLWTVFSGASRVAFRTFTCAATRASDIVRRPKGVVANP